MAILLDLQQEPTYWHLSVSGDFGYGECAEFRLSVHRMLMSAPRAAVVDLSGLEYLDSSGLGILVAMSREYAATGGQLVLITNRAVDNVLSISGLARVFATASSLEEAVQMLGHGATAYHVDSLHERRPRA